MTLDILGAISTAEIPIGSSSIGRFQVRSYTEEAQPSARDWNRPVRQVLSCGESG